MKLIVLIAVLAIFITVTGCMIAVMSPGVDSLRTESFRDPVFSSDRNSEPCSAGLVSDMSLSVLRGSDQMELNDVVVYNGIISEISVSPTLVTYDFNHDGIVEISKTVLFFNIG